MATLGSILAFIDLPGGETDETGRGLLAYGSRLAGILGCGWEAVTPLPVSSEDLTVFGAHGAAEITVIPGGTGLLDAPALLGKALAQLAREKKITVVLLPHNDLGSTLAPVVAAALDGAIMTELAGATRTESGLKLSRQALGGRVAESRMWDASRPLVITVPTRALSQVILPTVRPATPVVSAWDAGQIPEGASARITGRIPPDPQTVDLTEAEVIFSAGKGCDPAAFAQLKELCRILNSSLGVTRPVYDLGWTGFERMVGQTGRTVTPRLYVALGISGSMHHIGGIKDSRRIVSVNIDPKAPVFTNSDEGFVADLGELLPRLVNRVTTLAGGAP